VDAIEAQRSLLADPDPVRPLLDKAVDLLRQALKAKLDAFQQASHSSKRCCRQTPTGTSSATRSATT
jgi:hypothetical protein